MNVERIYSELFLSSQGICTDTRKLDKGQLYVALKGENHDGNRFAEDALEKGAIAAIVDDPSIDKEGAVHVKDGLQTLQDLARVHRETLRIPVIGITGSNGKTTTKELAARVLSKKYRHFATQGNLNNHIGLPLSVLSIRKEHEIALLEFGANHPGENRLLADISRPTHGLVTNIGLDHLEGFGNKEGVYKGNKELIDHLTENDGHAFFNVDDRDVMRMKDPGISSTGYGTESIADLRGKLLSTSPFLELEWQWKETPPSRFSTKLIGSYNLPNILAALAIGGYFGVEGPEMEDAVASYRPANKRSEVIRTGRNTVIQDAYNANPSSMEAAIDSFLEMDGERKQFILGDMLELGDFEEEAHRAIVEKLRENELKEGLLVGKAFKKAAEGSGIPVVEDGAEAREKLKKQPIQNALVLMKGSRGLKLEELLDLL